LLIVLSPCVVVLGLNQDEFIKTEEERAEVLNAALAEMKLPSTFELPLRADMEVADLLTDRCKYMDSKKLPLWLVFENAQPSKPPIYTIFKVPCPLSLSLPSCKLGLLTRNLFRFCIQCGDDLRQDMLTLQMLRIMDKMWKNEGYDLCVTPYGCIATGADTGFIEVLARAQMRPPASEDALEKTQCPHAQTGCAEFSNYSRGS
jgi:phosphatidylinositol-4,5-bisphosphate 3-kinase